MKDKKKVEKVMKDKDDEIRKLMKKCSDLEAKQRSADPKGFPTGSTASTPPQKLPPKSANITKSELIK